MDTLIRLLSILIGIGIIYLIIVLAISFFLIVWPILAITVIGLAVYGGVKAYFYPPSRAEKPTENKKESPKDGIVIDHRDDE